MNALTAVRGRALMATASVPSQAKSAVTAASAHWLRCQGQRVQVFKTGSEFLDPKVLACASGASGQPMAQRLSGDAHRAESLCSAPQAGLVMVEAVMGLHDGAHSSAGPALRFRFGLPAPLASTMSAVAQDAAFPFLYLAIFDTLRALGTQLCLFPPLANEPVPTAARALCVCSGYPELHLKVLAANTAIRAHQASGWPLPAERGGMLALLETLSDKAGNGMLTLGLLPGRGARSGQLVNLGLHSLMLPEGQVRSPAFDHARIEKHLPSRCRRLPNTSPVNLKRFSSSKGCLRRSCTCDVRAIRWPSPRCSNPEGSAKLGRTTPLTDPCRLKKVNNRCTS